MIDDGDLEDIKIYLLDEGLDDEQVAEFMQSHDLTQTDLATAWEIVEMHIFRDDFDDAIV